MGKGAFRLKTFVMSSFLLAGIVGTGLVGPNRDAIQSEFNLSYTEFGIGLSVINIIFAGALFLSAPRFRAFNPFNVLLAGAGVQAAGLVLVFAARGLWGILGGWALVVLGRVLRSVGNNISMDLWPENPRRGVILLHSFNAVGKVVGPLVVVACLAVNPAWRTSFLGVGLIALVILAEGLSGRHSSRELYAGRHLEAGHLEGGILRRGHYWLSVVPFGLISGGEAAFATLVPAYFKRGVGLPAQTANLLFLVHLVGLMTGRFVAAFFARRLGNDKLILLCLAMGIFIFPAVYTDSRVINCAGLFLFGFLFSATWPTFYAQVAPRLRGHEEMLAYGANLFTIAGVSVCVLASSVIADYSLGGSLLFAPAALWVFGALYFSTSLSGRGV